MRKKIHVLSLSRIHKYKVIFFSKRVVLPDRSLPGRKINFLYASLRQVAALCKIFSHPTGRNFPPISFHIIKAGSHLYFAASICQVFQNIRRLPDKKGNPFFKGRCRQILLGRSNAHRHFLDSGNPPILLQILIHIHTGKTDCCPNFKNPFRSSHTD